MDIATSYKKLDSYWKIWLWVGVGLTLLVVLSVLLRPAPNEVEGAPTTFFECARVHEVEDSFPRRCKANSGEVFYEYVGNNPQLFSGEIQLDRLSGGAVITRSPFEVNGYATQEWLEGGEMLLEANGRVIGKSKLMTAAAGMPAPEGFVAFVASIEFKRPAEQSQGALVIKKSGSADESGTLVIPVVF